MDEFTLRPATADDFPNIRALIHHVGINPTGLDWRRFWVAEMPDGQFAGCGQIKVHGDQSRELASIAVAESFRGRGIARSIIQKLAQNAEKPLFLTCRAGLQPFYEKFGFVIIPTEEMPRYFARITKLTGVLNAVHLMKEKIIVMRLD